MLKNCEFVKFFRAFFKELGKIVEDIRTLAQGFEFVFIFTPKKGNPVARADAHYALSINDVEI